MTRFPAVRRLAVVVATFIAATLAGFTFAAPAQASDPDPHGAVITGSFVGCDLLAGQWLIQWHVTGGAAGGPNWRIVEADATPGAATLTGDIHAEPDGAADPYPHAGGATLDGISHVTGAENHGLLGVVVRFADTGNESSAQQVNVPTGSQNECRKVADATSTCTDLRITVHATEVINDFTFTPNNGTQVRTDNDLYDGTDKTETFPGTPGLKVTVAYDNGDDSQTFTWTPGDCSTPSPSPSGSLPTTGASLTGITIIGGVLVGLGAILVITMAILGRRNRDKDA